MSRSLTTHKDFHEHNPDTEIVLAALAAYGPEEAVEYLYDTHDIETTEVQIDRYRRRFPEKYQEIQEKLAPKLEAITVTGARSNILKSNVVIGHLLEQTHAEAKRGTVREPAKVAEQVANVQGKAKDTMMALQGRPAVVKEVRTVEEIFRGLEAISPDLVIKDAEVVEPAEIAERSGDA